MKKNITNKNLSTKQYNEILTSLDNMNMIKQYENNQAQMKSRMNIDAAIESIVLK